MAKQIELDRAYMEMAYSISKLSHAVRRKVGAILVVPEGGRFEGVNGTPSGFSNNCETKEFGPLPVGHPASEYEPKIVTKPECLHAESNAIMKVARSTTSSVGGTMCCTLSPCLECAKLIIQAGIIRVVYSEQYPYPGHDGPVRAMGLELLNEAQIQVDNLPIQNYNVGDNELIPQDEGRHYATEENWRGHNSP